MDTSSVNETTGAGADSATSTVRWSRQRVEELFDSPFNDLLHRAHSVHRRHFDPNAVQLSTLLSVKTGGCPEDCAYCPQAARYHTGVADEDLLTVEQVTAAARSARANGATRFCMGAAWRGPRQRDLERVIEMVKAVRAEGLETCATLGLLKEGQAEQLKTAGLDYYNHNIDTAPEFYGEIITTRTQDDRRHGRNAPHPCGFDRPARGHGPLSRIGTDQQPGAGRRHAASRHGAARPA